MKLKITLMALASLCVANAATITVSNVDFALTNAVTDSAGTVYGTGTGFIGIGVFSITDSAISASADSQVAFNDMVAAFSLFGQSSTFGSGFSIAGTYQFESTGAVPGAGFTGNIYTVIGNAATLATSTEVLVYKTSSTFVADPGSSDPAILQQNAGGTLLLGGFNNFQANVGLGNAAAFNTVAVVPEPSAALLGALGVLGLLRRRRA